MSEMNNSPLYDDDSQEASTSRALFHLPKEESSHFYQPPTSQSPPQTSLAAIVTRAEEILSRNTAPPPEEQPEEPRIDIVSPIDLNRPVMMQTMEMHQGKYGLVTRYREMTPLEKKELDMSLLKKEEFALLQIIETLHQKKRQLVTEKERLKGLHEHRQNQSNMEYDVGCSTHGRTGPPLFHSPAHEDSSLL